MEVMKIYKLIYASMQQQRQHTNSLTELQVYPCELKSDLWLVRERIWCL